MNEPRICIVTVPLLKAGITSVSNLVDIMSGISHPVYLVTGNEGRAVCEAHPDSISHCVSHQPGRFWLTQIIKHGVLQLKTTYSLLRYARKVNICVFFMAEGLILPVLVAKLLRKKVVLSLAASNSKLQESQHGFLSRVHCTSERLNYMCADSIVLYSTRLIAEWELDRYQEKISVAYMLMPDLGNFYVQKQLCEREILVGYVGRMSEEKGTLNFIEAIPHVLMEKNNVKFFMAGDGALRDEVEIRLKGQPWEDKVELVGWIPHDELPKYLNRIALLILPSYTEGLPQMILEAMACGTPVLAASVGAIPDVIKDGATGFIMEGNSATCIAQNVLRALNHPALPDIARNARDLVEETFTYEAEVTEYKHVFAGLLKERASR